MEICEHMNASTAITGMLDTQPNTTRDTRKTDTVTSFENHLSLGDATVTIPIEHANKVIAMLNRQPDAELLIEMLGLDGAAPSAPMCRKHNVEKVMSTSGYYCRPCKTGKEKARREQSKARKEGQK